MSGTTEEGHFMRSQAYRSLRNFTRFYMGKEKNKNVPGVSEIASPASRGYLWRLSTKRMVYTHDWKRKYFVLTGDKLYYYDNELGDGVGPGAGVIHLDCFIDCVEAPLTDHKKATNVFILLAKERGLFEQGRYYLSAETLIDMRTWVSRIRSAIRNISRKEGKLSVGEVSPSSPSSIAASKAEPSEPEYASIKDYRIHRSNSMSTLPSLSRDEAADRLKCLNRSMHEDIDHNLTYSYSSSEDSLNESFSINFTPKKPRSAGGVRSPLYATPSKVKPEIRISSGRPSPGHHQLHPSSTPSKTVDTSAYLQKMYQDMDRVDKQLELVAKLESGKADIAKLDEEDDEMEESENMEVDLSKDLNGPGSDQKMQRMEEMMKDLNQQSEDLQKMFRKLTAKRHSVATVEAPGGVKSSLSDNQEEQMVMSALLESLARYQDVMKHLQSQAKQLMTEIKTTHSRVLQSLAESQVAKKNFLELKQKAEVILAQLQQEEAKAFYPSESQYPLYATVRKDRRGKGPKVTVASPVRNSTMVDTDLTEEEAGAGPSPYQLRPRSLMLSYKN